MRYAQYQVTGHCAHVTVVGDRGPVKTLLMRGAPVPGDAPEVRHLLSVGLIAPVGEPIAEAASPEPSATPEGQDTTVPSAQDEAPVDDDTAKRRADAQAKLPTDGSAPDGRAGQAVWVEYLVTRGYDYDTLKGEEKDALRTLAEQVQGR